MDGRVEKKTVLAGWNKMRKIRAYEVQTKQCTIQKHKIQIQKKKKKKKKKKKLHEDKKEA